MKRPLPGNLPGLGNVVSHTELLEPSVPVTLLMWFGLGSGAAVSAWNCLANTPQIDNPNSSVLGLLPLYAHLMPNYLGEGSSDVFPKILQALIDLQQSISKEKS